jgi:outer membrane protein assembly factor BamB
VFNTNTGEELFELRPDDAHSGHLFSDAVAISGDTILVGAPGDDQGIASCGSAYLFRATTGEQLFKLVPDTRRELQRFGTSVAISGNWALVGADGDYGVEGTDTGAAYLFDVTTGEQLLKLTASDRRGDDFFGTSVAISGNWGLVGAYQTDDAGSNSGSAYLFDLTSGEELAKLVASDAAAGEYFGCSVAISGKKMLIGTFPDADGGADLGSAYLLTYVPEPSTLLLAIGAAAMALRRART